MDEDDQEPNHPQIDDEKPLIQHKNSNRERNINSMAPLPLSSHSRDKIPGKYENNK